MRGFKAIGFIERWLRVQLLTQVLNSWNGQRKISDGCSMLCLVLVILVVPSSEFYAECFGMKLLRKRDVPEEKYSNAFLGFGPEESHFVTELTYNMLVISLFFYMEIDSANSFCYIYYGVTSYDIGIGPGHFAIATPDDPAGFTFELIDKASTPEPLCQVMLRVGDLDCSVKFYAKALGMKLVKKVDRPKYKYSISMMGYAKEHGTVVLELTYNYGVTAYTKGNAYAQASFILSLQQNSL
ncbi:hypothetical protein PTKIN_Ptkin15bG0098200 [Pterospermum kingtungense]